MERIAAYEQELLTMRPRVSKLQGLRIVGTAPKSGRHLLHARRHTSA